MLHKRPTTGKSGCGPFCSLEAKLLARGLPDVAHVLTSVRAILAEVLAISFHFLGILLGFLRVPRLEICLYFFAVGGDFLAIRANLTIVGTNVLAIRGCLWVVSAPRGELCPRDVRGCFQRGLSGLCQGG